MPVVLFTLKQSPNVSKEYMVYADTSCRCTTVLMLESPHSMLRPMGRFIEIQPQKSRH